MYFDYGVIEFAEIQNYEFLFSIARPLSTYF